MDCEFFITTNSLNSETKPLKDTPKPNHKNESTAMKKSSKKLVGLITLMPYSLLGLLFIDFLIYPQELLAEKSLTHLQVGTGLWIVSLLAFYLHHVFSTKSIDKERRLLWGIVLLLGNVFAMPIYWYRYIWHQQHQPQIIRNKDGSGLIGF